MAKKIQEDHKLMGFLIFNFSSDIVFFTANSKEILLIFHNKKCFAEL